WLPDTFRTDRAFAYKRAYLEPTTFRAAVALQKLSDMSRHFFDPTVDFTFVGSVEEHAAGAPLQWRSNAGVLRAGGPTALVGRVGQRTFAGSRCGLGYPSQSPVHEP